MTRTQTKLVSSIKKNTKNLSSIDKLKKVMSQLRDPKQGCPWDLEQNFKSIAPHTLEETYEVVDAIEKNDLKALKEELGDLLFQIAFHAQLGEEQGLFSFDDIADGVATKMIERHPHVFGNRKTNSSKDVIANWETDKAKKRAAAAKKKNVTLSVMDDITLALPALTRAVKIQKRASSVGFDWIKAKDVLEKIKEEIAEFEAEIKPGRRAEDREGEMGDILFAVINLARWHDIDPETALRKTNVKFERRFRLIENALQKKKRPIKKASLKELEQLWNAIKSKEKKTKSKSRSKNYNNP